jgi:hypothetical protein
MSESHRGKVFTEDHKKNISNSNKGKTKIFTKEHKENLSKSHKGKSHSDETKNKMSNSHKKPQNKLMCPFCKKIGGNSMKMWHFNNCKFKHP